jgi:hypothetical protein
MRVSLCPAASIIHSDFIWISVFSSSLTTLFYAHTVSILQVASRISSPLSHFSFHAVLLKSDSDTHVGVFVSSLSFI